MKIYCELCKKVQPVQIDNGIDLETKNPYQDIVCGECNLVIASGTDIAPPKREWVGLTNADKHEAFDEIQEASGGFWEFADYLEAKLKEKNT